MFNKKKKRAEADDGSLKSEYLKIKAEKRRKHKNSRIRHPIKSTKRGYGKFSNATQTYWSQGARLGHERMKKNRTGNFYNDRDAYIYVYKHSSTKQKITVVVVFLVIIALVVLGAMH